MLIEYLQGITVNIRMHRKPHMPSRNTSACLRQTGFNYLMTVFVLLLAGCASPGATLKVTPRHEAGIQYSPREITGIMEILGYEQLRVVDPDTRQPVSVATDDGVYKLLFQHLDNTSIRVDIHIVIGNGNIGLHIYQSGRDELDNAAMQQVERLRQRLIIQYGAGHVRDSHPALAP